MSSTKDSIKAIFHLVLGDGPFTSQCIDLYFAESEVWSEFIHEPQGATRDQVMQNVLDVLSGILEAEMTRR